MPEARAEIVRICHASRFRISLPGAFAGHIRSFERQVFTTEEVARVLARLSHAKGNPAASPHISPPTFIGDFARDETINLLSLSIYWRI